MKSLSLTVMLAVVCVPAAGRAQGNAASFDGDADAIEFGALDPGTSFTVEAWLNSDRWDSYHTVFEVLDPATNINSFFVGYVAGQWQIEIEDNNATEGGTCAEVDVDTLCHAHSPDLATNIHVAVVVEPSEIRLYLDGALAASEAVVTSPGFGADLWHIGADIDGGPGYDSDPYEGRMDEVRVWSEALSEDQIVCAMDYALSGTEPGLYAHWAMDENAGDVTVAETLGNWDGTVAGDTTFVTSSFALTPSVGYDIGCLDYDGDGYTGDDGDCDETDPAIHPGATEVSCDYIDNDCDGVLHPDEVDYDGDGYDECDGDCDDSDAAINPGAAELACNYLDDDCDGVLHPDEVDDDGEGYDE